MSYDMHATIAAVASALGGAARGVIRVSGPDALERLAACFMPLAPGEALAGDATPRRIRGSIRLSAGSGDSPAEPRAVPGELFVWPTSRSYTRQPAAEFHTFGSPPLLAAVLEEFHRVGIRPAEPGEFTLRAFLAGRIDLTQAEAVLGVIDARHRDDLDAALDQLAGGLSRPLHQLREELLALLAEVEAGLDFVDEDVEFISRESLRDRLAVVQAEVYALLQQIGARDVPGDTPRVVLTGPPNAGKSSLFNALVRRYGDAATPPAIVSPTPGATRDFIAARLNLWGVPCELIDTAGLQDEPRDDVFHDDLRQAAKQATLKQRRAADLRLHCFDATTLASGAYAEPDRATDADLVVLTKIDAVDPLAKPDMPAGSPATFACSSVTGAGVEQLARQIAARLGAATVAASAATAERCRGSLWEAARALAAAAEASEAAADELLALELRGALDALGEIVGAVCADDVLDRVFSQFCIGK